MECLLQMGHIYHLSMCAAASAMASVLFERIREEYVISAATADQTHYIWLLSVIDFFYEQRDALWLTKLNYSLDLLDSR